MLQLTASSQSFSRSPVSLFLFPPSYSLPSRYSLRDLIQMAFCALKQLSRMSSLTEDGLQPDYNGVLPFLWPWELQAEGDAVKSLRSKAENLHQPAYSQAPFWPVANRAGQSK